jgi:hypothetical protein
LYPTSFAKATEVERWQKVRHPAFLGKKREHNLPILPGRWV